MFSNKKFGLPESLLKAVEEAVKSHTVPKSDKDKKLASLAEPKDKITHKDVMVGRGVIAKEEVEEIDERASKEEKAEYEKQMKDFAAKGNTIKQVPAKKEPRAKFYVTSPAFQRKSGKTAGPSTVKMKEETEEVEELDELSKGTLASYAKKATRDARIKMATGKDFERIATSSRKPAYKTAAATWERRYKGDARKREAGVEKAIDRLAKEEVELDEISDVAHAKYRLAARADIKAQSKMLDADSKAGDRIQKRVDGLARSAGLQKVKQMTKLSKIIDKAYEELAVYVNAYEEKDTPGNSYEHQCAVHVKHAKLGEGKTLFSQHADPAEDGSIEWYDVMFEHGIERVQTSDIEILVSESHMNHKKKGK